MYMRKRGKWRYEEEDGYMKTEIREEKVMN